MIEPIFVNNYDDTYKVSQKCLCGNVTTAKIQAPDLFKYRQGAHVQNAFPYLSLDEREALFISGTCAECWESMYPADEDF